MGESVDALHQPHVQLFLRLVLGAVLLLAGITKLADRSAFRTAITEYEVLPAGVVPKFAAAVPVLETATGLLLLLGLATTAAAAIAVPLFLSFSVAIGINLLRGRHFNCHCFGSVQSDPIGTPALLRSMALAAAALAVALGTSRFGALEWSLFGSSNALPPAIEVLPVVFVAAVAIDILILLPETLSIRQAFTQMRAPGAVGGHRHSPTEGTS